MSANEKVIVNLTTGLEDAERVTVALLVACAALDAGKRVGIWLTKEAVRRRALPAMGSASPATAAHRWSGSWTSLPRAAASCCRARSASTRRKLDEGDLAPEHPPNRRNPALGVDRRWRDGLQLLTQARSGLAAVRGPVTLRAVR